MNYVQGYTPKRIMKIILCTPIFLPLLVLGLFFKIIEVMEREAIKLVDRLTWIDKVSDWIHKP